MAIINHKHAPKNSRLVRYLGDLDLLGSQPQETQFSRRLGRLIDLSDSVSLADKLSVLSKTVGAVEQGIGKGVADQLKSLFIEQRRGMVEFMARSFVNHHTQDSDLPVPPFRLPIPADELNIEERFKPYQRFYGLHQSEMEHQIQLLMNQVREQIEAHSPRLALLIELDRAMTETMQSYFRSKLSTLSTLLKARFEFLFGEVEAGRLSSGLSVERFVADMKEMLMGELDLRLQPVLGLIEACEKEEIKS